MSMTRNRWLVLLLTLCLAAPAWHAQQQKNVKDEEERALFTNSVNEKDPNKKLQLLEQWKQKYPGSDFKDVRAKLFMQTYQQLNQFGKAVDAAREVLSLEPKDFTAHFTIASLVHLATPQEPKLWQDAEKSANALITGEVDKPANVPDDAWNTAKKQAEMVAQQALGYAAKMQKKNDAAEQALLKALEQNASNAMASYWLGEAVLAQRNPDKNTLALFCFARAAAYDGPGALVPAGRQQVDAYLTKLYTNFHGSGEGLAELKTTAKARALPPSDLKIKSKEEMAAENEEKLRKENPLLARFLAIKEGLTSTEGAKFWEEMKGKAMPKLRGTVVSITPSVKPKTLGIAISQPKEAEIQLTPETTIPRNLQTGAVIEFEGAEAVEYTAKPFLLKLQDGKITSGLPEPPPAAKRPAGKATKGSAKKKAS